MLPDFLQTTVSHATYKIQGRSLSQDDVGKKVLRITPVRSKRGILDFSYMTIQNSADMIFFSAGKVISVTSNSVILEKAGTTFQIKKKYLDSNWLTVDEYLTKISGLIPDIISVMNTDPNDEDLDPPFD